MVQCDFCFEEDIAIKESFGFFICEDCRRTHTLCSRCEVYIPIHESYVSDIEPDKPLCDCCMSQVENESAIEALEYHSPIIEW